MTKLRSVPLLPWWTAMAAAERLGAMPRGSGGLRVCRRARHHRPG
nr:hypothetical protein [Nocardioides sp. B-3]